MWCVCEKLDLSDIFNSDSAAIKDVAEVSILLIN